MQATAGCAAPVVLCRDRLGNQLSPFSGVGPDTKTNILCEQSIAGARGEVPSSGEGSLCRGILGKEASSLLLELHSSSNDGLTYPKGAAEAGRSKKNSEMGGGALGVRCSV